MWIKELTAEMREAGNVYIRVQVRLFVANIKPHIFKIICIFLVLFNFVDPKLLFFFFYTVNSKRGIRSRLLVKVTGCKCKCYNSLGFDSIPSD